MENEDKRTALTEMPPSALVSAEKPIGYWAGISRRYMIAFRIAIISLFAFVIIFFAVCPEAFSYDNFFYFTKDLAALSAIKEETETIPIAFAEGEEARHAYRGGVAVVTDYGVRIYGADGKPTLSVERQFRHPRAAVSRNYLIAYDFGGTSFSVCNAYAELFHGETEFPILYASMSDSGCFSLVTTSNETISQVLLYNGNFRLLQRFGRASATVGTAISENGRYIAVLGATSVGAVLDVFAVGDSKPASSRELPGFPYAVGFIASSTVCAVTDKQIFTSQAEGKVQNVLPLDSGTPIAFQFSPDSCAVALSDDLLTAGYRVIVLNKRGGVDCEKELNGDLTALCCSDDYLWILENGRVLTVDKKSGETVQETEVVKNAAGIDTIDRNAVCVFYPAEAVKLTGKS